MTKNIVLSALLLASTALTVGCASSDDVALSDEVDEIATAKADRSAAAPLPIGTFDSAKPTLGDIRQVTLNADLSFARYIQVIDCIPLRGCGPETGTVKFTRNTKTGARFVRFYDADGDLMDRYQYTFDGRSLSLRRDDETASTPFTIHAAAE